MGTVKVNSLPSPEVLVAEIAPLWESMMWRAIDSPRPVPGCERAVDTRQGGQKRKRLITIRKVKENSGPSVPSGLNEDNLFENKGYDADANAVAKEDMLTQETNGDDTENGASVYNPLRNNELTDENAKTAKKPFNSDSGNESRESFAI